MMIGTAVGYLAVVMLILSLLFGIFGSIERTFFLRKIRELAVIEMKQMGYEEEDILLSPKYVELLYNLRFEEDLLKYENGEEIESIGVKSAKYFLLAIVLGVIAGISLLILYIV
jgi:hypothetical protein